MQPTRRSFLESALAVGLTAELARRAAAQPKRRERPPNVLFIISDEHNVKVTGCYDNKLARTPHLDSLAERGVTFDAAYCNSPLCVPSRLSFISGKYIARVGAWSNACWLPSPDIASLPRILNAAGYESFLCGKMHLDATRRYGYADWGGNMNRSFKTGRGRRRGADDLAKPKGISGRFKQFYTSTQSGILNHDRKVTAGVRDFLARRKRADKPFFLTAGYLAPHFPLIVAEKYWLNHKDKIPMPVLPPGHLDALPLNYKHLRTGFKLVGVPDEIVKKGRELYYGLTEWFDKQVGMILNALADTELADDTIVIYTTDHGENMGEHGLWWKNCMYEHAARVPLIVSWPKRWTGGQRRTAACSLVDVVQTIAQLAAATCPDDWNGDSLLPWLDNPKTPWKDQAVSEYYAHNIASGFAMLRTGRFKYVYHVPPDRENPAERELYDLAADPGEFTNLAARPEHKARIETLHAALLKELGEDPDETEQRSRADYAKGYGRGRTRRKKKT